MGCTPSIHVSQTGVVYCRDSDESNSPRPSVLSASTAAQCGVFTHTVSTSIGVGSSGSKAPAAGAGGGGKAGKARPGRVTPADDGPHAAAISEAETQTQPTVMKQGVNSNLFLGPMRIRQHTMSVLLVFSKEDAQSDGFWWAAEKGGYKCHLMRNAEGALECYLDKHHDVVIIDARHSKHFDAESLCRSIRATKSSEHTVILAVTKKVLSDKEEPSIMPLLTAGFNKRFIENTNVSVCMNELLQLEHGEVQTRIKLRAANALVTVLENCSDAVEVSSENYEIQYVNPAYERLFGYSSEEVVGKDMREVALSDSNRSDLNDTITSYLKKGKPWDGVYSARRKGGDALPLHCQIKPVIGQTGKIRHFVSIRNPTTLEGSQNLEKYNGEIAVVVETSYSHNQSFFIFNHTAWIPSSIERIHMCQPRRESMVRMHHMTIEAPITKVINIINAAQENSPITVVQSLDKVLEILRSTELYSPYFNAQVKEDSVTSELVGGLMTDTEQQRKRRISQVSQTNMKRLSSQDICISKPTAPVVVSSPSMGLLLAQAQPEIQNILVSEQSWDFDIINLERVSQKRPLLYLGLKMFQRFGVMDFLQVSETEMANWLQLIEANYHANNPYHNSTHAADVMHGTAYFLRCNKIKNIFDPVDEVASLLAAVVHDLDHPGRTNSFLVNAGSELALLYNDLAVLESHHVSLAFHLTQRDPRVNIFAHMDREDFRVLREQMIDMVLATEMTRHFEHLNKFVSSINQPANVEDEKLQEGEKLSIDSSTSITSRLNQPENKRLIKRVLIKCADVSNPCRPVNLCREWARRIADEYCQQTDEEKEKGLPVVMPIFDRRNCNIPKSQIGFIDFFITDMFDAWDAFCDVPELMGCLEKNRIYWKEQELALAEAAAAEKQTAESSTST